MHLCLFSTCLLSDWDQFLCRVHGLDDPVCTGPYVTDLCDTGRNFSAGRNFSGFFFLQ